VSSLSDSTIKQYSTHIKSWWLYCTENTLDIFSPNTTDVIRFLNLLFTKGASYGTLNSARSALSLILDRVNGDTIGELPAVKRFLKGAFRLRPTKPKYNFVWDTAPVLDYLSSLDPLDTLTLKALTLKLAGLLALATGQRLQTLAAIVIPNIRVSNEGIHIVITDVLKTTKPGNPNPSIFLPFLKQKPTLCVASVLLFYKDKTSSLRNDCPNLLITFAKPHGKASSTTIGRWIKLVLHNAGIDASVFSAHSSRHASTSAASRKGVSIENIRKSAGWTPASSIFQKHYQRPIIQTNDFVERVLLQ